MHKHFTQHTTMNPYESDLRFRIYQEARSMLEREYNGKIELIDLYLRSTDRGIWSNKPLDMNPKYPSPKDIDDLANSINNFVNKTA
jgi:hypothetical protein